MPDLRTLGSVNLNDATKYRIPASSESENKVFEVVANPVLNSNAINLGMADHVATELTMEVWVTGTSWAAMLTNYAAIQTALDAAAAYSIAGTGSAVTYQEQAGDQGAPTVYTVKWGKLTEDRTRRLEERNRRVGRLYLYCLPHD
jgi:hypothetical protein